MKYCTALLVLLGGGAALEGAEVAAPAGLRIDLAGIEAIAPGRELADHGVAHFSEVVAR